MPVGPPPNPGGPGLEAALSATEGHDTGALVGHVPVSSVVSPSDGPDRGVVVGLVETAILTHLEGGDVGAGSAGFASPAHIAAGDGHDLGMLSGALVAARLAGSERRDTATVHGLIPATIAVADGRDTGQLRGISGVVPVLAATEGHDTASATAVFAAPARLGPVDGADLAALHASTSVVASASPSDGHDRPAIRGVALPPPPFLGAFEGPDVAVIVAGVPGLFYHIYRNDGMGGPIDYAMPIATVGATTWTAAGALTPGTWLFGVRASDEYGEEKNLDCAVEIVLDESLNDITNRPAPPFGLRCFATGAS